MSTKKIGRPADGDAREKLTVISFKADDATLEALRQLVAEASKGVERFRANMVRSTVIRRAVIDAARVLTKETKR